MNADEKRFMEMMSRDLSVIEAYANPKHHRSTILQRGNVRDSIRTVDEQVRYLVNLCAAARRRLLEIEVADAQDAESSAGSRDE